DACAHRAAFTKMEDERPRVHTRQRGDAVRAKPFDPLRASGLAHDHAGCVHGGRLAARVAYTVVADHRRREADDLAGVARVGDDLLVARHRGREHGFADCAPRRADALAREDLAVLEHERAHASYATRPAASVRTTLPRRRLPSSHEFAERD